MGVPAGTDGSVMSTGAPVVKTVLPVAAALTNGDGNPPVSADHPGDDDEIAAPPAFTTKCGVRAAAEAPRGRMTASTVVTTATMTNAVPYAWQRPPIPRADTAPLFPCPVDRLVD